MRPCGRTDGSFTNLNIFSVMESNWNFPQLTADKNKEIFLSTVARITKIIGQTLTGKQQPSVMCRGGCCWRRVDTRAAEQPRTMLRCSGQRGRGPGSVACRPAADPATHRTQDSDNSLILRKIFFLPLYL